VQDFIGRWFRADTGPGYTAASHSFATTTEFEEKLYDHLRALIDRRAGGGRVPWQYLSAATYTAAGVDSGTVISSAQAPGAPI
jgi:hypothetical protein